MKTLIAFLLLVSAARLCAQPNSAPNLGQPISFDRLTVWIIDGGDRFQHHYMTLEQALASGRAVIFNENSQTLQVKNLTDTDLFIESGDLIKGGQQDRMIADDRILPAKDSADDLDVFCIERGRSTARGTEPLGTFSSSHWMAPFAHTRLVARADLTEKLLTPEVGGLTAPDSSKLELLQLLQDDPPAFGYINPVQESIWNDVAQVQRCLTRSLKDSVTRNASPTSLVLSLENGRLADRIHSYERHFSHAVGNDTRSLGFVYAIDGKLVGAEQYATHALFAAMWPKLLRSISAATIATELSVPEAAIPSNESVQNFLSAPGTKVAREKVNARTLVEAARTQYGTRFVTWDERFQDAPAHVEWVAK